MEPTQSPDYILCECDLPFLIAFTEPLAAQYPVRLVKAPSICLTMIRAEDSVEKQEFYLGEALTTDCEVAIGDTVGYGICLGDEPQRAWCLAVLDATMVLADEQLSQINAFLAEQSALIRQREKAEFAHIMRTKVDFKLMEQL